MSRSSSFILVSFEVKHADRRVADTLCDLVFCGVKGAARALPYVGLVEVVERVYGSDIPEEDDDEDFIHEEDC